MKRRIYTTEAVKTMRAMKAVGATDADIAREIGSTPRSVRARTAQLGLRKPKGFVGASLNESEYNAFLVEAKRRGMRPMALVRAVLSSIATENLFSAVLDV